jgi:hypothetical protein
MSRSEQTPGAADDGRDDLDDVDSSAFPLWFDAISPGGNGRGFLEKGDKHSLLFVERPVKRLLVTFDNLSNVSTTGPERMPWAFKFAHDLNVSHLGVMAHLGNWFRDPELIARMQRLAADGFFEGYDRVLFAGTSMGAYASIAFGSLVPGAHVAAFNPQSTLNPDLVPWETRYWSGRRQDWTLPLSDAAQLTADLGPVHIFFDPYFNLDLKHFNRFSGDNIHRYDCWLSGHKSALFLRKINGLKPVMERALMGELDQAAFYRIYRERRRLPWYRAGLESYFLEKDRTESAARVTQAFRRNLRELREAEAAVPATGDVAAAPERTQQPAAAPPAAPLDLPAVRQEPGANTRRLIVTTMKNEGPFMLEWVAYNRAIGFTDFLIYTNDCDDNTDAIAQRLQELGVAHHEVNRFKKGGSPQRTALRKSAEHSAFKAADWAICADCDEFLNIRTGDGILDDLFDVCGAADAISICWKLFGNSGRAAYQEGFVTEQFRWSVGETSFPNYRAQGMKTLVRVNEKLQRLRIHRPLFVKGRTDVRWVDGGGRPMPPEYLTQGWKAHEGFTHDHARLHHYAVRSVDSFLVKRDRGRTNHVNDDQGTAYWSTMNYNAVQDESILRHLPAVRAEYATLLADPVLAELHAGAVEWHKAKIAELRGRDGWNEFREKLIGINAAPEQVGPAATEAPRAVEAAE